MYFFQYFNYLEDQQPKKIGDTRRNQNIGIHQTNKKYGSILIILKYELHLNNTLYNN